MELLDDTLINNFSINSPIKLSKTENDIINLICKDEYITKEKIASSLNKEISTIKKAIIKLKRNGLIYRDGPKRNGKWIIKVK